MRLYKTQYEWSIDREQKEIYKIYKTLLQKSSK